MIGCGDISERFFRQAKERNDVEFVATCARHMESAMRKAQEKGIERWYDDYETMMDEVKPDGVVVTTPHSVHVGPTLAALERKIHVLNEKPMATTLDDCRAMAQKAAETGAIYMQLPLDHGAPFLTALNYLNEETLGKFTGAEAVLLIPGPPRDNWYYDKSVAQGGAMMDCMVYPMSRLISFLGPAKWVAARVNTLIPHRIVGGGKRVESDVDDNVTLIVEWESGQQAVVRSLWGTSFGRNDTTIYGRKGTLWLDGGNVVIHSPEKPIDGAEPIEWRGFSNCYRVPVSPDTPNESLIGHFVESIKNNRQPKCNGQLQLHVHEILHKGYQAAETGKTQEIESTFMPWHDVPASFYDTRGEFI
jgi:predicted dehydrogenase